MNKICYLIFASLLIFVTTCSDNPEPELTTSIELNFKASYGDEQFLTFQEYDYPDGKKIQFSNFHFFISDVSLVKTGASLDDTELIDVELVDLGFDSSQQEAASQGITFFIREIPIGEYSGVKLGFGVTADLNRTNPSEYGGNHPLTQHYWDAWESYIFATIEGGIDINGDGEVVFGGSEGENFSYHCGSDEVFSSGVINQTIDLRVDAIEKLAFDIDVEKLFKTNNPTYDTNGDGFLDIETFRFTHTEDALEITTRIMENFMDAVDL